MIGFLSTKHRNKNGSPSSGRIKKVVRRVKYESELDLGFGETIAERAYGQKLLSCIQCGTCSATCPLSYYMDFTPRRVIAMVREGFREEALNSFTIWLCASCYSCTVQCPRQIHITDVMYTLKREAIAREMFPRRYPIPILARGFFDIVHRNGRNSEGRLLLYLYLRTNILKIFQNTRLGLHLLRRGRMSVRQEKIHRKEDLRSILGAVSPTREEPRS
ncbi:MAG TPA: 4Fe-4S dicluster domain-containing protein [Bacteroidota bacterium]|nr:4Fe-4S dicluster domain-containing protein [Bacteroidota bacterium]